MARTTKNNNTLNQEDLFISLEDSQTKRKNLLLALKNSLLVQEEATKLKDLREEKLLTQKEIKKNIDALNQKYQELKKKLPNVKNTLSMTEKEIHTLETHIDSLKKNVEVDKVHIKDDIHMKKDLEKTQKSLSKQKPQVDSAQVKQKATQTKKTTPKKNMSKLDRIKNNLSIIEDKLKDL